MNRLRLAFERVAFTVFGGVRRRVVLLVREEPSVGALERLLCRFGEDGVLVFDPERFRLRAVPSAEEVLERLDLEPFF